MASGAKPAAAWMGLLSAAAEEWRATPFYRVMLRGADPERIAVWGEDFRRGDPSVGADIQRGVWRIGAERLSRPQAQPWSAPPPSEHYTARLHSFSWLADVAMLGPSADETIEGLIASWVQAFGDWHAAAWAPELAAERVFAWLCHGRPALESADAERRAAALRSLGRQARHVLIAAQDGRRPGPLAPFREPLSRIKAGAALTLAGLAGVPEAERMLDLGEELLIEACAQQFFADGGHKSRAPEALLAALCDMLTVDLAFARAGRESPPELRQQAQKMASMLRLLRLGDGRLASFHGGGEGQAEALEAALRELGAGRTFLYATQSGYQRLAAGDAVVVLDVGGAPPRDYANRAHAGALAFEMSSGPDRLIVNVGSGFEIDAQWRAAGRATNGHSTLVVDDALSAVFEQPRGPRAPARPVGPDTVSGKRAEEDDGVAIEALHDGYRATYGLIHRRILHLRKDGDRLFGMDSLARPLKEARSDPHRAAPAPFALRFHVHPSVAIEAEDARTARLTTRRGHVWRFRADAAVAREDSVYLGAGQPQRTAQLVVEGAADPASDGADAGNRVFWTLTRVR